MLNEMLKDEELGKIVFAELLNQNGCDTGVNTSKLLEESFKMRDNMEDMPMNIRELEEKGKDLERLAEPDYYADNGLSPLEAFKKGLLSREETIGFIKGNVIKYTVRAGKKENASRDIVKAIDYLTHLKRLYEKEMRNKVHLEANLAPIDFNDDTAKQVKEKVIKAIESIDEVKE